MSEFESIKTACVIWSDLLVAFGTLLLAVAAFASIWAVPIRKYLAKPKPKLVAELSDAAGVSTVVNRHGSDGERVAARYYHCKLTNLNRAFPFHGVRLMLQSFEVFRAGEWHEVWNGYVALRWRHEEPAADRQLGDELLIAVPRPYEPKVIGPRWDADLFHVTDQGEFKVQPFIVPNNLIREIQSLDTNSLKVRLTALPIAEEADGDPVTFEVHWDGVWVDGEKEMATHLKVRQI
ncbi:hypothetical protein [Marinicauda salina]|uniref:hypothetical protein n=1 Tax=Marinicauda salina TaxID=2135793 RepID=UPI0011B257EB|nr:hypothetical protein [Marinicauda salina]